MSVYIVANIAVQDWYESPEYQAISEHRRRGSRGAIVAFEGL
jgi:uncharacterized protein (DUF1330 family)